MRFDLQKKMVLVEALIIFYILDLCILDYYTNAYI